MPCRGHCGQRAPGPVDDYTSREQAEHALALAMARLGTPDSWKPTQSDLELGLRYRCGSRTTTQTMASFDNRFSARGARWSIGPAASSPRDASTASCCPATLRRGDETFRKLASLQRLYRVPNGFETPKDASTRLGSHAINERTTFRAGVGDSELRRSTRAARLQSPLSEMQTVINGMVDAPGGASRNFPPVMAFQSPEFAIRRRG